MCRSSGRSDPASFRTRWVRGRHPDEVKEVYPQTFGQVRVSCLSQGLDTRSDTEDFPELVASTCTSVLGPLRLKGI